jgi:hypothetical protein
MRLAVRLTEQAADQIGSISPHPLVREIMKKWGYYDLRITYSNAWEMADNLEAGAQCIDIVRFVNGLLQTIGSPGTSTAIVVWAKPSSPTVPERSVWPHSGEHSVGGHPAHPEWIAGLIDANGCPNNYEAALEFDYGGIKRYYPGGVPMDRHYTSVLDVLQIFQCLAWLTQVGPDEWNVEEILTTYPGGSCSLGRIRCSH